MILDEFPTIRPDVSALFGVYLPKFGVLSDLVAQRSANTLNLSGEWLAGRTLIAERQAGRRIANRARGFLHDVRVLLAFSREQYDAIQVRDKPFIGALALWTARLRKVPFFYWMSFPISESTIRVARIHGVSLGVTRYAYMMLSGYIGARLLYRIVIPHADFVFAQSETMREAIVAHGALLERTMAIPMCVDPERFTDASICAVYDMYPGREVVAYLGTCDRIRRIDFLLDVIAHLRKTRPNILLLLIGDASEGLDRIWLRDQIKKHGCEQHVVITGWMRSEQAQAYLANAKLAYALMPPDPILNSASPTKLVEYMAMGKPVIANEHPDQSRLLSESQGGYCVRFEVESFVAATLALLDDATLANEIGYRGRAYVMKHRSYLDMARRLADTYRTLLCD
jgi:glycosyltransferase involved in cell wall biosynthesis